MASSGEVDIFTSQNLLGHKTDATTNRLAHLPDEALKRGILVADYGECYCQGGAPPQKGTHKSGPHFPLGLKRTPGPAGYFRYNSRQPCNRSSPEDKALPAGIYGVYVHRKRHGEYKRQNRHAIDLCSVTHCQHLTPSKRCSTQRWHWKTAPPRNGKF